MGNKTKDDTQPEPVSTMTEAEIMANIKQGTTEQKARDYLAVEYRKKNGVIDKEKTVRFFDLSSKGMKGFSILNSALGLSILIMMITNALFFSKSFYIALGVGLLVGLFFEVWSTSLEKYFSKREINGDNGKDTFTYRLILVVIKIYAVIMVSISGWQVPSYAETSSAKADNTYITNRLAQIKRLEVDKLTASNTPVNMVAQMMTINDNNLRTLRAERTRIELEKTPTMIENSTCKYPKQRASAKDSIDKIDARLALKDQAIERAIESGNNPNISNMNTTTAKEKIEKEINIREDQIDKERQRLVSNSNNSGKSGDYLLLQFMFVFLFVVIELGGTFASIFSRKELNSSISVEEVYKEEITEKLMSRAVARDNREVALNATKIRADLSMNKVVLATMEAETNVANQQHLVKENSRISKMRRNNAEMLTTQKIMDMDADMMIDIAESVAKKTKTAKDLDDRLNQLMLGG